MRIGQVSPDDLNRIIIYQSEDGKTRLDVKLQEETVWLSQLQMMELFDQTKQNISLHIGNIFNENELVKSSTVKEYLTVQKEGKRNVKRKILLYNLDVIISVGYRVKSQRGTQFRIWANKVLKDYLVKGYALNERRLTEARNRLEEVSANLRLMGRIIQQNTLSVSENQAFLNLISDYAAALDILDKYDHQQVTDLKKGTKDHFRITLENARSALQKLKDKSGAGELFARPKDKSFASSLAAVYQTFDGTELYPLLEDKAAHLLYFVVKNHSFIDGNKRIGAFLLIWFLERNQALLNENGLQRISNETLIALTILVAESRPEEKEMMIKLIKHLIKAGDDE